MALNLLFGLPLLAGGIIIGLASMLLLALQSHRGQRAFEYAILVLLAVIAVGFVSGLGVIKLPAGPAHILGESGWIITALLYVAEIASIFFAFIQVFIGTSGF